MPTGKRYNINRGPRRRGVKAFYTPPDISAAGLSNFTYLCCRCTAKISCSPSSAPQNFHKKHFSKMPAWWWERCQNDVTDAELSRYQVTTVWIV